MCDLEQCFFISFDYIIDLRWCWCVNEPMIDFGWVLVKHLTHIHYRKSTYRRRKIYFWKTLFMNLNSDVFEISVAFHFDYWLRSFSFPIIDIPLFFIFNLQAFEACKRKTKPKSAKRVTWKLRYNFVFGLCCDCKQKVGKDAKRSINHSIGFWRCWREHVTSWKVESLKGKTCKFELRVGKLWNESFEVSKPILESFEVSKPIVESL